MTIDDADELLVALFKWHLHSRGYAARSIGGRKYKSYVLAHRWIVGADRGDEVDHINGDKLDNRRVNLRLVTHSQNICNRPTQSNNTSGYRGVYWHRKLEKWGAQIKVDGRQNYLGVHLTLEDAARAYDAAACRFFGEFARPNFT